MKCFVPSCKNRSDCQNWKKRSNVVNVTFHCLPKDSDACSLWLDLLGIEVSVIPKRASICSMHFEETSFYIKGSYVRLKPNALPRKTLNVEGTSCNETMKLLAKTEEIQSIASTFKLSDDCPLSPESSTSNKEDKGTMVSPKFVHNSPEKQRLRERVKFVETDSRKKLCNMRRQLQRKEEQVIQLKNIIKELKRQKC